MKQKFNNKASKLLRKTIIRSKYKAAVGKSSVVDETHIDNMGFFNYQKQKLITVSNRRFQHWFEIFRNILAKIQFPSIMNLLDREEIELQKS